MKRPLPIHHPLRFYIDGEWVDPLVPRSIEVVDPATEEPIARISLGSAADVDRAVTAARRAFASFSVTTRQERLELLERVLQGFLRRLDAFAELITLEMGAPIGFSRQAQAAIGVAHLRQAIAVLRTFPFLTVQGSTALLREPIGVAGLITPWNWPVNQVMCKVAPALVAGCTLVLKPSEIAPLDAILLAEVMDEAGVPAGVFNLVNGDGPGVGAAIAAHPGIDMVSFTGSTRAGISVARAAAESVKRVTQELGGKSANLILEDADMAAAVAAGVKHCFLNAGQSCNAPTRMFVPRAHREQTLAVASSTAASIRAGDPFNPDTILGPVVSDTQFARIQSMIQAGIDEGATLVAGGTGRPAGIDRGWFVRPTVFADVTNGMTIAREEIFGPVLSILFYDNEEDAIAMANDSPYGLSGYVQSGSLEHARQVAARLRTGNVHINGAGPDFNAPFGGYKASGCGREWGEHGVMEFLELKAVMGYQPA